MQPTNTDLTSALFPWPETSSVAAPELPAPMNDQGHTIQFYENADLLVCSAAGFLAGGSVLGQPLLVIASAAQRVAIAEHLKDAGLRVDMACQSGALTLLDASDLLAAFITEGRVDAAKFRRVLGRIIEQCHRGNGRSAELRVRVYAELTALLLQDGNIEAVLQVEALWNELERTQRLLLLCAYDMGRFNQSAHAAQVRKLCELHSQVIPTERYTRASDVERLIEISLLQQGAHALEHEVEHRNQLDRELREAEAARRRAEGLQHRAEALLRRSEIEQKHALMERDHARQREQEARLDSESANRAKSEFLAVMSHELRTPLNAIAGYAQLIEMGMFGPVTEAQTGALSRVRRSQEQLLALINDVLNFTHIDAGRVDYALEELLLMPLLAETVSLVEPLFMARQLTYEIGLPPRALHPRTLAVRADREKVEQILLNLLINAVKFTAEGGRIAVAVAADAAERSTILVQVRDTGKGIPETKLQSIFEPFVQLGVRVAGQQEGVGLGLAISRELARGMGGELSATSALGAGSCFTLRLPLAQAGSAGS